MDSWNALPSSVVNAPTLNCFKSRLDRAWASYKYSTDIQFPLSPQVKDLDVTSEDSDNQLTGPSA